MGSKEIKHHYAGVLLVTTSGRMIGQQRDDKIGIDNPGQVATFGGTVEAGESYKAAAWRELITEETNIDIPLDKLELFFEDVSWRQLTSEYEARHFYFVTIDEKDLETLEVYEGKGWAEITGSDDPRLVEAWRVVIQRYLEFSKQF